MMQSDDDLAQWISTALQEAKKHSSVWRMHAREWYDFYAGNQWEEEAKAQMIEQRKVPVVFNRVARTVNAVIGLEIQNRQQVQYIPREPGDTQVNELYTSAADWIRDNCDAEDEESESFQDLMISGIGGTETRMDYDENPDGQPVIERVDPLELYWDPVARKKNLRDRRWCARIKRVSDEDIREMWPDYVPPEKSSETYLDEQDSPHDSTRPLYNDAQPSATQPKHRELVCFQWWEREQYYRFQDIDGQIKSISAEQAQSLQERMTALNMPMPQMVKQTKKVYNKAYLVGGTVLESMPLEVQSGFTLHLITGARDRNNNTWFGLVALMMDPQRWANKWLSQIMHILNSSAKGGLIAERDAFAKTADAEASWAKAETITWANPGAVSGGKIQPKPTTAMPDGFAKLLDFAVNSINDVPGVNMELMGLVGTNQPGVLENMRKQAGMTILAVFFDAIRLYRKDQGRIMIEIIRDKISDGRLIRVLGKDGAQYIPLLRDESAKEFDVVVDEAPTSPNNKERVFAMMTQLAPVLQNSGIPLTPDLLEYSPLPAALVQKWQAYIQENKQVPPELQAQMMQMQQVIQATQQDAQKLAQENFKLKTDATVEVYRINEQSKVDRELAAVKAETESGKRAVEVYEANLQAALDRMQMMANSVSEQMRAASQAAVPHTEMAIKGLGESLTPVLQRLMEVSASQVESLQGLGPALQQRDAQFAQAIAELAAGQQRLAELAAAPKRLVRDANGRAIGAELQPTTIQ
jgi:hypothetical protein